MTTRRTDALTRARIIEATIEILDTQGEQGLTVRAVTAHLSTGRGAIYHHITNKDDLLSAATEKVITTRISRPTPTDPAAIDPAGHADSAADERVVDSVAAESAGNDAAAAIRALATGIFDTIDAHPWAGPQLSRDPSQPAVLHIWTTLGTQLHNLGVPIEDLPTAGAALVNYVLGAAAQHAAGPRKAATPEAREAYLTSLASKWTAESDNSLTAKAAASLTTHDDRTQFQAGIDIFLTGITTRLS